MSGWGALLLAGQRVPSDMAPDAHSCAAQHRMQALAVTCSPASSLSDPPVPHLIGPFNCTGHAMTDYKSAMQAQEHEPSAALRAAHHDPARG
jgi:hypothetical protein